MSTDNIVIAGYSETPVNFRSGRSAYDFAGEAFLMPGPSWMENR